MWQSGVVAGAVVKTVIFVVGGTIANSTPRTNGERRRTVAAGAHVIQMDIVFGWVQELKPKCGSQCSVVGIVFRA